MQAFLESFATVDEVYQECKKRGIKGVPGVSCKCIVAELLKSEYPERFENGNRIHIGTYGLIKGEVVIMADRGVCVAEYILPSVFCNFALTFDEGQYPDLVKESTNDR